MALPEGTEFREYRHDDAEGFLKLHDSRWRPIPRDFWQRWSHQPNVTASVALVGGRVVGQIPFHIREFLIRPGVTVRVAQEHSVIVAEEMRSQGIGSCLMAEAERFLRGRCEVMTVYRGGEQTPGYRFYQRTGHHDLTYYRTWLAGAETPAEDTRVTSADIGGLEAREDEVLRVFRSAYANCAGFPPRRPGYWKEAVQSIIYREMSGRFRVYFLEDSAGLAGYALCLEEAGERGRANVLELATRDGEVGSAVTLLRHAAHCAREKGASLTVQKSDESVYADALRQAGFGQVPRAERSMMTMARVFDPQALAERVLSAGDRSPRPSHPLPEGAGARRRRARVRGSGVTLPIEVTVWTPERQAVLNPSPAGKRRTRLEMKEPDLARLLLCRMDVLGAVREERVTVVGARPGDLEALAQAFPFSPWDYHALDYI
jgi:GNAT superfamily N-acetyltransferase